MNSKLLLFLFLNLLAVNGILAQEPKSKKSKSKTSKSTEGNSSKSSKRNRKGGGKEDTYKSDRNRDKKQDTQSMLKSQSGQSKKEKKPNYVSRALYYGGRTYTGTIENIPGFRICVYTGNNRQEAMRIKSEFNGKFRLVRSYMSYNLPNYKIKVGNYEDKKVATKALKEIQASFPAAFLSPDKVTVVRRQLYVKPPPESLTDNTNATTNNNANNGSSDGEPKPKKKKKKVVKATEEETAQ